MAPMYIAVGPDRVLVGIGRMAPAAAQWFVISGHVLFGRLSATHQFRMRHSDDYCVAADAPSRATVRLGGSIELQQLYGRQQKSTLHFGRSQMCLPRDLAAITVSRSRQ
jgi:hypothetical protein